jgi:hypothetical protein
MTVHFERALSRWSTAHRELLAKERLLAEQMASRKMAATEIETLRAEIATDRKAVDQLLTLALEAVKGTNAVAPGRNGDSG